jgi:hypothetical protein
MGDYAARLPAVLGAAAALITTGIGFIARVSPLACLVRSVAAFALFAAIGIVMRFVLSTAEVAESEGEPEPEPDAQAGATVEEWMAADEARKGPDGA